MTRKKAVNFLLKNPYKLGWLVGFDKLTELHNEWIKSMILGTEDKTLQAHRGSYKTTCVSIALAIIIILFPNDKTLFMRKTDTDIKEIIKQVQKILESPQLKYIVKCIYGCDLKLIVSSATEINTNLSTDIRGTSQLVGRGTSGSLTGKHFDRIFTDDIVNMQDRMSKAERDRTKAIYQELQNIKNRNGRIFNTGTPWHADDCFTLMPNIEKYDVYSTGLISQEEAEAIKNKMLPSLFSANYELKHIADEDVIFTSPKTGADISLAENGIAHIDASYGGADFTAFTICSKGKLKTGETDEGKPIYAESPVYYVFGKLYSKHIDDVEDEIISLYNGMRCGKLYCEDNGDKGYLARDLKKKGVRALTYHETTNKYLKITSYLKSEWDNVIFVNGTDTEYINQVCDYNENAEHDDAPDSLASIIRKLWAKKDKQDEYVPLWN